jgi:proteasome beta subunit
MARRIFPVVTTVTGEGFRRLPEAEVAEAVQRVVADRMTSPDGPVAPLRN